MRAETAHVEGGRTITWERERDVADVDEGRISRFQGCKFCRWGPPVSNFCTSEARWVGFGWLILGWDPLVLFSFFFGRTPVDFHQSKSEDLLFLEWLSKVISAVMGVGR